MLYVNPLKLINDPAFNRRGDALRGEKGAYGGLLPRGGYPCPSLILPSDTPLTATERGRQGVLIGGVTLT